MQKLKSILAAIGWKGIGLLVLGAVLGILVLAAVNVSRHLSFDHREFHAMRVRMLQQIQAEQAKVPVQPPR